MAIQRILAFALGAAFFAPAFSGAESLADIAAREKERRKGKSGKVITENDLRRAGSSVYIPPDTTESGDASSTSTESASGEGAAPAKPAGGGEGAAATKPKSDDEIRDDAKKAWRERMDKASAEVTRLQSEVTTLEQNPNIYLNPGAVSQLDKAKQALAAARQQVDTLEDERRRNGY